MTKSAPSIRELGPLRGTALTLLTMGTACYEGLDDPRVGTAAHASSEYRGGTAAPCATGLAEVDGVVAFSNGEYTGTGWSCAGVSPVGALQYQCVELAQRYMHEIYGLDPLWPVAAAAQMCDLYPSGAHRLWAGEAAPWRGDLAVWTDGTWGHVAVVAEVRADGIVVVEQNASVEGKRLLVGDSQSGYFSSFGTAPDCFIRADDNPGPAAMPEDSPADPPPVPAGAAWGASDLVALAHGAGLPCEALATAAAIALAESSGRVDAINENPPGGFCPAGSRDRGLWQINDCAWPTIDDACAFDPACNAAAMVHISEGGADWGPWAAFGAGTYIPHLAATQAAVDQIAGCGAAPEPLPEPPDDDPPPSGADCSGLGYLGACFGDAAMWWDEDWCHVRDCAAEGLGCGWLDEATGWGCVGGVPHQNAFDCAVVGYAGTCLADGTLLWVEGGSCLASPCAAQGNGCAWNDDLPGYDCA